MIKNYSTVLFFFMGLLQVTAQQLNYNQRPEFLKANSVWAFGAKEGIDFNSGNPVPILTDMITAEGCASVSDPVTGKLLFYSNGGDVWNANHQVMPNGDSLLGNRDYTFGNQQTAGAYSTSQGVCIVPVIGEEGKYYLFSLSGTTSGGPKPQGTLFYSIVDMKLDNGFGDIISTKKNIALDKDLLTEAMIAVPGDNCDVWLMVFEVVRNEFRAYHIAKDGIDPTPVVSTSAAYPSLIASMAIANNRKRIAMTSYSLSLNGISFLGAFNPATGQVANTMVIDSLVRYSACFSPDDSKLYLSSTSPRAGGVSQFDLSVYNDTSIRNSRVTISPVENTRRFGPFRLYNDTIYQPGRLLGKAFLTRINQPNLSGSACDYQDNVLSTSANSSESSIGSNVVLPFSPDTIYNLALDSSMCSTDLITLNVPEGFGEYIWENGSTATSRNITTPGTYWVLCKDYCYSRVDTFRISGAHLPEPVITIDVLVLGTTNTYATYQWLLNRNIIPGATDSIYKVAENGDYQVIVTNSAACADTSEIYKVTNVTIGHDVSLPGQIHIFPNPAREIVYINAPIDISVELYTIEGRLLKAEGQVKSIDIAPLSQGIYLLKIYDTKGRLLKSEKVVK